MNIRKIIIPEGIDRMNAINDGYYLCKKCGAIMDVVPTNDGTCDILQCPNCNFEMDEMDYEFDEDNDF